jgi:hypothetical protein
VKLPKLRNNIYVFSKGYNDNAERWQARYEIENFQQEIAFLWEQVKPLFQQIHAYLRRKLWEAHGKDNSIVDLEGPIPASLLGKFFYMFLKTLYSNMRKVLLGWLHKHLRNESTSLNSRNDQQTVQNLLLDWIKQNKFHCNL